MEGGERRIYGAGLLSSFGESRFSLESEVPTRRAFSIPEVLRTRYRSDAFQHGYFVIPSFAALLRLLTDTDLAALYGSWRARRTSISTGIASRDLAVHPGGAGAERGCARLGGRRAVRSALNRR